MGQLIVVHTTLHIIEAPIAIAVFLGLAIYVITCNSYRPISWVFSILCLTIASVYLSSLFTTSVLHISFSISDFLMHWKWVAIALSSTLYLHLIFFYFPPTWQRCRFWALPLAYLFNASLALTVLFIDLWLSGHLYRPIPHFTDSTPGSFVIFYMGFFVLEMMIGTVGLLVSYHLTHSPSFRQQTLYLLVTASLALGGGIIYWMTLLTETTDEALHLLSEAFLILAAVLYAQAVVRYGSFVGGPLARRSLFYSVLATVAGLIALYLTLTVDQWLAVYSSFPFYLVTGILVLIIATSFPSLSKWLTERLDRWFFQTERYYQALAYPLAEALAEAPDLFQLQAELLEALRTILGVANGYIALSTSDGLADKMIIHLVQGNLPLQPGDLIRRPPLHCKEPQLAAALLPQPQAEPGWQEIALFCPITLARHVNGVLALSEKRDRRPFSLQELVLAAQLIKQLDMVGQRIRLRAQRDYYLEVARLQEQTLQRLGERITPPIAQLLTISEDCTAPLEIRILGPLQVTRKGQPVSEAAWGSEKAKGLLAYLLWKSPGGVTRAELSQALWPNRSTDETANVFHVTLHRLRRVLQADSGPDSGLEYIQHDRGRYRFNTNAPHWLDLTTFQALIVSDEPSALQAAVELYRGAYLEDMVWALPVEVEAKRQRLEQLYADALRRLVTRGNEREAMRYLEKLLIIEPADETAHSALMLSYLTRGRGDLARRQVEHWRQALADFDLEPSPETKSLWQLVETKSSQSV